MNETQQRIGEYAIVRKIGEGGMGVVYLATDLRLGRTVALKTMPRALAANEVDRERFLREARVAASVEHDNIVPIWNVGEAADGTPFIVMPLLQGESLDDRLRREPMAPLDLILKVAREVAEGLAAAHARELIHRDVKPANIWLEGDPLAPDPLARVRRCKILDFGLARSVHPGDAQLTASGLVLGTPAYMAPEQARGEPVDHRADLFSLGVVLYRMATGQPPFRGDTPMALMVAVVADTALASAAANPNLPPDLAELIDRLLHKAPEARPRSAADVARAARAIRAQPSTEWPRSDSSTQMLTPAAGAPAARTATDAPARRRWRAVAITSALLLVLVPFGLWLSGAFDSNGPGRGVVKPGDQPKKEEGPPPVVVAPSPRSVAEKPAVAADPDRAAALWVVEHGGVVCVDDGGDDITSANGLPPGPFRLTSVTFTENATVRDEDLVRLAECRHLVSLGLSGTTIGDAGLAHLKGCRALVYVYLQGTPISSAGLGALRDCPEVLELDVSGTRVDDEGLKLVARFGKLSHLLVTGARVTPEGVAGLARVLPGCEITWSGGVRKPEPDRKAALWVLSAGGSVHVNGDGQEIRKPEALPKDPFKLTDVLLTTPVKDADLEAIAGCKALTGAYLVGTGITSDGLMHFKDCKGLTSLNVSGTLVGDESIPVIKRFTKLTDLSVGRSAITEKGVRELAKALPGCRIQHDGGTTGPTK